MGGFQSKGMSQAMRAAGLHRDPAEDNRRTSGLQAGASGRSPAQPGAVIVLIVLNLMFWLFQYLFFSDIVLIWLPISYGLLTLTVVVSGYIATAADSRDPMLIYIPGETTSHTSYSPPPYPMPTERVFSPKDGRWVFATSKFCRATGKCVDDFDHYCLWLNNSIGAANYAPFLYALVSASALVLLQTGVCCAQVILWGADLDYFKEHAADTVLSSETDLGIILCVFLFTLIIGLGFLFQLLFFHAYLIYHGITTYEFVADRERMRAVAAQGLQGVQPRFMVGTPASRRARRAKIRAEHAAFAARRLAIRAAVWHDILAALKEKPGMDAKAQQHFVRDFAPVAYAQRCREHLQGDKGVQGGSGATAPGIEMTTAGAAARNTMQSHESATSAAGSVTAAKHLPGRGAVAPATSGEAVQGGLPEGWASGADSAAAATAAPASTEDADAAVASGAPEGIEMEGAALPASKSAVDVAVASQNSGVLEGGPETEHYGASAGEGGSDDDGGSHGSSREEGGEGGGQHPPVEQRASDAAEASPITEGVDTEAGSQQVRSEASSSSVVDDTADPGVESAAAEKGGAQGSDAAHPAAQSDDE